MRYQLLFATWFCFASFLDGQTTFNHRFHFDTPATYLTSIVPTDSCYYATGIYADTLPFLQVGSLFVKLDLDGNPVFVKKLISPEKSYETRFPPLVPLEDGTFVVSGISYDPDMKGILIKYDKNGDTLWTKEYLNPFYPFQEYIVPFSMARMPDKGFVLACWITKSNNQPDIYLLKTDNSGNKQWGKVYGNNMVEMPKSLLTTSDGDIIVGGTRNNLNLAVQNYIYQCLIFRTDSTGNVIWNYLTNNNQGLIDAANDMVLTDTGSLVIATNFGTEVVLPSFNIVKFDKMVFKLNVNNSIEWQRKFKDKTPTTITTLNNVVRASDGSGFVIAGISTETTSSITSEIRGWIGKVSPEGDSLWTREYIGVECDNPRHQILDLKETPDGGFILCGESKDLDATNLRQQAWLLKLDQHGCLVPGCYTATEDTQGEEPTIRLAIYPNPTSDYLNFYLRTPRPAKQASFRIINMEGKLMQSFKSDRPAATFIVPVQEWAAGVYFLQYLEEGVVRASEKFIKHNGL